ncbi:hypothetical protein ACISK3_05125 [Morganella morganii]|nr:hypothetical protein [Morganella morganii]
MDSKILELAKELKRQAKESIGISDIELAPDVVIELCEYIENTQIRAAECDDIIKAACDDDAEWHKLLDDKEHERALLVALIISLADAHTKVRHQLDDINKLVPSLPDNIKCPTAPELIWLQVDPEPEDEGKPVFPDCPSCDDITTWCSDRINPTDTLYIRADLISGK